MGDEAKAAVHKLETEHAAWETSRTEWHETEADYKEKLAHAQAEATKLAAAEEALASAKGATDAHAATAAGELAAAQASAGELQAELEAKSASEGSLSAELASAKESCAAAAVATEAANGAVVAAKEEVARLEAKEQELGADVSRSEGKIAQMKEQMGKAKEHMDAQQAAYGELKGTFGREMKRVRSELAGVKASNAGIRGAAVVMKDDIAQVTPKVQKRMLKHFSQQMALVKASVAGLLKEKDARIAADHLEKRKLHNTIQELKGNIRVFCRARPLIGFEIEAGEQSVVSTPQEGELVVLDPKHRQKKKFEFDEVFGAEATQDQIFEDTRQLIRSCCDGYNVCVFAYGQTGAGKTHTMEGTPEQPGVNYRALEELFKIKTQGAKDGLAYTIELSLLEIYCDEIRDLLTKEAPKKLEVKQAAGGTYVPDLTRRLVNSYDEVCGAIAEGQAIRQTAATQMNAQSSRSHCMLQVYIKGEDSRNGSTSEAKLSLVDLAGCERISRSGADSSPIWTLRAAHYQPLGRANRSA